MDFVRTAEELERIQGLLSAPEWSGEWLSIQFTTDPDLLARLLPPPLQPVPEPLVTVTVGRWQSSCLGEFAGGSVGLSARHDGVDGSYVLALYMDREPPIVFGRELFGEPKKLAASALLCEGGQAHAWIERHGERLIDLRASVGPDLGPSISERYTFNFKARTHASGWGLQEDAILTRTRFAVQTRSRRRGDGHVKLRSGPHDPIGTVAVREVRSAVLGRDHSIPRCAPVATVDASAFLPYHYGRQDDWLTLAAER